MTECARIREAEFLTLVEKTHDRLAAKELKSSRSERDRAIKRIVELEGIIRKLYEDNATGRIPDDRFDSFYAEYDAEQDRLKQRAAELDVMITGEDEKSAGVNRFLGLVRKYTDTTELTAEIVRVFIDRIVVHQATGGRGKNRKQRIDIFFNFIGLVAEEKAA